MIVGCMTWDPTFQNTQISSTFERARAGILVGMCKEYKGVSDLTRISKMIKLSYPSRVSKGASTYPESCIFLGKI